MVPGSHHRLTQLRLAPGGRHIIRLPGLGSAGYLWQWSIGGEADAVRVESASEEDELPARGGRSPEIGGVTKVFTITGVRPGRAVIELRLVRPWEREPEPLERETVEIEVASD